MVTGYAVSPRRGRDAEFATLVAPEGDDFVRVQRLAQGPSGIHLDLHVDQPRAAETARHVSLGAGVLRERPHWTVLTSPQGSAYCITDRDPVTGLLA